uniref:Uncharacterized protein n=1 Tax=Myotis myotis TaxID=51298 RepID=A0A7J8AMS9_MYOMY|nr:hypothetical protein mMyoMyo1_008039 [Myotis myotis]
MEGPALDFEHQPSPASAWMWPFCPGSPAPRERGQCEAWGCISRKQGAMDSDRASAVPPCLTPDSAPLPSVPRLPARLGPDLASGFLRLAAGGPSSQYVFELASQGRKRMLLMEVPTTQCGIAFPSSQSIMSQEVLSPAPSLASRTEECVLVPPREGLPQPPSPTTVH